MMKISDPAELMRMIQDGEISLDDLPPEAMQYAASEIPDVGDDFWEMYLDRFIIGGRKTGVTCSFCKTQHKDWKVAPYFGSFIGLRSFGTQGIKANKEVFVCVSCGVCGNTFMFNVREQLENIAKMTEELDVQLQEVRDNDGGEQADAEGDPSASSGGQGNGEGADGSQGGAPAV